MTYGIIQTNTWTKYQSLYFFIYKTLGEAEKAAKILTEQSSSTDKVKNNAYSVVSIQELVLKDRT